MKIHAEKMALATSLVVAALCAICWAVVAIRPDAAMSMTEDMLHMRMENVAWHLTPTSLLVGALAWGVACGGAVWLVGRLYNRLCASES